MWWANLSCLPRLHRLNLGASFELPLNNPVNNRLKLSSAVMKRIRSFLSTHPGLRRFLRYSASSVVASLVSAVTLAVAYGPFDLGPRSAAILAFCSGALVAFLINRLWAWERRDRGGVGRDFVRYWVVAIATALIALGCTSLADSYAKHAHVSHLVSTVLVEGAYFGSYAVTFVAKFLLLDRFVFGAPAPEPEPEPRSRAQVDSTTRA
jgi:putative flippase GtrA